MPGQNTVTIEASHAELGDFLLHCDGNPQLLFTENDTNNERIFGTPNATPYVKDGINNYVVAGREEAVNPNQTGTKAAAHYQLDVGAGETAVIRLRLSNAASRDPFGGQFDQIIEAAPARGRRVLSGDHACPHRRRCGACDAAGAGRDAVEQAVLLLRYRQMARGAWRRSDESDAAPGAQPRVVPHDRRPRHLDAGQVGISMVCGLGPGLSHARAGDRRHRFRQAAARSAAAPGLPASDRADPGL